MSTIYYTRTHIIKMREKFDLEAELIKKVIFWLFRAYFYKRNISVGIARPPRLTKFR